MDVEIGGPSYGDTLSCKSDNSTDIATLRIVPGMGKKHYYVYMYINMESDTIQCS